MSPSQIAKVARREYLARVRSRAFIVMTAMIPLLMGGYIVVMPLIFTSSGVDELRIAVLDAGTGLAPAVGEHLAAAERPRVDVTEQAAVADDSERERQPFTEAVLEGRLDGYLVLTPDAVIGAGGRWYARETGNLVMLRTIERAVEAALLDRLVAGSGVDTERVRAWQRFAMEAVTVSDEGESEGGFEAAFFSTFALAMLLYMAVLINGQGMAMAIVEEKSSRLIEVILGAVTATEFMAGKILGVLGSGLTQLGIWIAALLLGVLYAAPMLSMAPDLAEFDLGAVLSPALIVYFAIFFALGYFLYSVFFAAIAATCTSTEELGQSMFAAVLPMVVALMSSFYVIANPGTVATRVLSLLPPLTPIVMLARVNVLTPPLWEIWLGIALLALGVAAAGWLAARIFRYALLMHGKRPTLPELLSVVRAS